MEEVSGRWVRGRPRLAWTDGVNVAWATEELRWGLRGNALRIGKNAGALVHI